MTFEPEAPAANYEKDRVWDRILSFHKKGIENRKKYHLAQGIIITAGALIPIINVLEIGDPIVRAASSILGAVVIAITGFQQLKKYQENWILYRTTEEALRREYYLYSNKAEHYDNLTDDARKKLLVQNVEALLLSQYSSFFGMHKEKTKPKTGA